MVQRANGEAGSSFIDTPIAGGEKSDQQGGVK